MRPSPQIVDPELRGRARLHSTLLLVLLAASTVAIAVEEAEHGFRPTLDAAHGVTWIGLLFMGVAYALSRTRHYTLSACLTVFTLSTIVWRLWAVEVATNPQNALPYFAALPLILSALLLPLSFTLIFVGLTMATVLLMPRFAVAVGTTVGTDQVVNVATFVLLVSSLVVAAAYMLEQARRQLATSNKRLRRLEASRIQFLNQVAHDLASPLTPIKIQVSLLDQAAKGEADVPLAPSVEMIARNVSLFERLIEDVRELSKMEAGQLRIDARPTDLHDAVQEVGRLYAPVAREAGVGLQLQTHGDGRVHADPRRLQQVLNNLVSNAIKFTPAGGQVEVTSRLHEDAVEVHVRDTGRGLALEEIGRLFKPFSQVHDRKEVKERGTGLGLYICKGIVEAHGGRIWVQSDGRGKGSTFSFTLPRPASGAQPPARP